MKTVPELPRHRLPSFWSRMGFTAKAGWLCAAHLARDYSEACEMLKAARRPKSARIAVTDFQARMDALKLS